MESFSSVGAARRAVERAAATPFLDHPPAPAWYCPAAGAWSAALVLALAGLAGRPALAVPAFLGWFRRRWGTWPRLRAAPPEIARAMRGYAVGAVAVIGAVVAAAVLVHPAAGAGVALVGVTTGLWVYERAYARAADAVRRRLS